MNNKYIDQDGVYYSQTDWEQLLERIGKLKEGDPIWNHYRRFWDAVDFIQYHGQTTTLTIDGFIIHAKSGYCIYDLEHLHDPYCPEDETFDRLNQILGIDEQEVLEARDFAKSSARKESE